MTTRRETLSECIRKVRRGDRTVSGLDGCPVGGWPETAQGRAAMASCLPHPSLRNYTTDDVIAVLYTTDAAGRYRRRGED